MIRIICYIIACIAVCIGSIVLAIIKKDTNKTVTVISSIVALGSFVCALVINPAPDVLVEINTDSSSVRITADSAVPIQYRLSMWPDEQWEKYTEPFTPSRTCTISARSVFLYKGKINSCEYTVTGTGVTLEPAPESEPDLESESESPRGPGEEPAPNLEDLNSAIYEAKAVSREEYTNASLNLLDSALADAEAMKTSKVQTSIDKAANDLYRAIDALEKKPIPDEVIKKYAEAYASAQTKSDYYYIKPYVEPGSEFDKNIKSFINGSFSVRYIDCDIQSVSYKNNNKCTVTSIETYYITPEINPPYYMKQKCQYNMIYSDDIWQIESYNKPVEIIEKWE